MYYLNITYRPSFHHNGFMTTGAFGHTCKVTCCRNSRNQRLLKLPLEQRA